jgi:hypothetical protein
VPVTKQIEKLSDPGDAAWMGARSLWVEAPIEEVVVEMAITQSQGAIGTPRYLVTHQAVFCHSKNDNQANILKHTYKPNKQTNDQIMPPKSKPKSSSGAKKPNVWMVFMKEWRKKNPHVKDPIEQAKQAGVAYRSRK